MPSLILAPCSFGKKNPKAMPIIMSKEGMLEAECPVCECVVWFKGAAGTLGTSTLMRRWGQLLVDYIVLVKTYSLLTCAFTGLHVKLT